MKRYEAIKSMTIDELEEVFIEVLTEYEFIQGAKCEECNQEHGGCICGENDCIMEEEDVIRAWLNDEV